MDIHHKTSALANHLPQRMSTMNIVGIRWNTWYDYVWCVYGWHINIWTSCVIWTALLFETNEKKKQNICRHISLRHLEELTTIIDSKVSQIYGQWVLLYEIWSSVNVSILFTKRNQKMTHEHTKFGRSRPPIICTIKNGSENDNNCRQIMHKHIHIQTETETNGTRDESPPPARNRFFCISFVVVVMRWCGMPVQLYTFFRIISSPQCKFYTVVVCPVFT